MSKEFCNCFVGRTIPETLVGAKAGVKVEGPVLLHVGERTKDDPRFASDEFVLAPPGTVVAPRPHNMKPTVANARKAIAGQLAGLSLDEAAEGATVGKAKACKMLEDGSANGKALSKGQKKFFGFVCSGGEPTKAADGAIVSGEVLDMLAGAGGMYEMHAGGEVTGGGQVTEGTDIMSQLLASLLGGAGTGIDSMGLIIGLMQALGQFNPAALGVTDPQELRDVFAGQGGNFLARDQFQEQQRQNNTALMQSLGFIIPGLSNLGPERFEAGLARATDPNLDASITNFGQGTNIGDIGAAVRDVRALPTLQQRQQEFNQAVTGFQRFGLGASRPSRVGVAG